MYFEDDETIPSLVPVRRKKNDQDVNSSKSEREIDYNQILNIFPKQGSREPEKDVRKTEKEVHPTISQEKIDEIDKKFKNILEQGGKKQSGDRKKNNQKEKQMQKSKFLITEVMRKIDAKNITEELYPVTNQTIEDLIKKFDQEIYGLKIEAERKENSLMTNPNNQHLKKELEVLKTSIDRCVTIKELYNEKTNLRNKVSILERNIIGLKEENQNLKIKINRGMQTMQNHMHNLPCEREKELKQELNKCQAELKKEKDMREKLELNVSQIVLNFKRLYEEADVARLIVTRKLTQVQEREKLLMDDPLKSEADADAFVTDRKSPQQETLEQRRNKKSQLSYDQPTSEQPRTAKKVVEYPQSTPYQQQTRTKARQPQRPTTSGFSLEDQIKKMRINQSSTSRSQYNR